MSVNTGPVSAAAKARIEALVAEGSELEDIYEAIGRRGKAVDFLVTKARATRHLADLRVHRYWLRPGLEVTLSLPPDLSSGEAERLAEVVRNLPF